MNLYRSQLEEMFQAADSHVPQMRRVALRITSAIRDRRAAEMLHHAIETAIVMYEVNPRDGRAAYDMINWESFLSGAGTAQTL